MKYKAITFFLFIALLFGCNAAKRASRERYIKPKTYAELYQKDIIKVTAKEMNEKRMNLNSSQFEVFLDKEVQGKAILDWKAEVTNVIGFVDDFRCSVSFSAVPLFKGKFDCKSFNLKEGQEITLSAKIKATKNFKISTYLYLEDLAIKGYNQDEKGFVKDARGRIRYK